MGYITCFPRRPVTYKTMCQPCQAIAICFVQRKCVPNKNVLGPLWFFKRRRKIVMCWRVADAIIAIMSINIKWCRKDEFGSRGAKSRVQRSKSWHFLIGYKIQYYVVYLEKSNENKPGITNFWFKIKNTLSNIRFIVWYVLIRI